MRMITSHKHVDDKDDNNFYYSIKIKGLPYVYRNEITPEFTRYMLSIYVEVQQNREKFIGLVKRWEKDHFYNESKFGGALTIVGNQNSATEKETYSWMPSSGWTNGSGVVSSTW